MFDIQATMGVTNFPSFYFWDSTDFFDKKRVDVRIVKYKRNVRGEIRYFYRKVDSGGKVLYQSPGFMTRSGRNKAVVRLRDKEGLEVEE